MEKVVLFTDKKDCSGCGACAEVCPKKAIRMVPDPVGCVYPEIDALRCVGCQKCVKICPYGAPKLQLPQKAYAAVGKQETLVENSASGGVFATLAHSVLTGGGMAAGAVMDEKTQEVYHILSSDTRDIPAMQGSKYVQSDTLRCFGAVLQALDQGKTVFFSGTPCQVAAIRSLAGERKNLITADIICHGVPPVKMLREYLAILGRRLGGRIEGFAFRDKTASKPFTARVQVRKRKKTCTYWIRSHYLSFYRYFLEGVIYRENCYSCPFADMQRCGDLTLGDYWGIEKFHKEDMQAGRMPSRTDWSCVLVNTPKGEQFLEEYGASLLLYPTKPEWVAETNQQLKQPSKKHPQRERVLHTLKTGGYDALEREYIRENGGALRFFWRMLKTTRRA